DGVGAEPPDERHPVEHVAPRLAELLALNGEGGVDEGVGGRRPARPPPDPPVVVGGSIGAVVERVDVVAERIPPDVDDLVRIAWHTDAPAARPGAGTGDAEVLQAAGDEGEHLVPAGRWLDPQPATLDQLVEPVLVTRQAVEPVLLGDARRPGAVLGTAAPLDRVRGVELLAADAVQPLVLLAVEVAGSGRRQPEALDAGAVAGVPAGADEVVETERERPAQGGERGGVAVDQPLDLDAFGLRRLQVLQRVVVGTGEE